MGRSASGSNAISSSAVGSAGAIPLITRLSSRIAIAAAATAARSSAASPSRILRSIPLQCSPLLPNPKSSPGGPQLAPLTLVYQDDILRIYWHEKHQYYLSDWQPVFRKGEELRRAYQACIDAARARPGALWLVDASKFAVIDPA